MSEQKTIILLFEYSDTIASRYRALGYNVIAVDLELGINIYDFDYKKYSNVVAVFAHPPCTEFAGSGARWWKDKPAYLLEDAKKLVRKTLEIIDYHKPAAWFIENPVGRISECIPELNNYYKAVFNPCDYGDPYTKKTCLWGCFIMPPYNRVKPVLGSKMHHMSGKNKLGRSLTPAGFADAFVKYNQF